MDLEIRKLEVMLESVLNQSDLSPEIKRLVVAEQLGKLAAAAQEAIKEQSREVTKQDAESVSEN